jgi:hypothetical protein
MGTESPSLSNQPLSGDAHRIKIINWDDTSARIGDETPSFLQPFFENEKDDFRDVFADLTWASAMKIIFDRSAFHDHFDLLKGSPLLRLANERKVLVYHTGRFLEETLKRQGAKARDELRRQWPFLRSICNGGWFKPLLDSASDLKSVCDDVLKRLVMCLERFRKGTG